MENNKIMINKINWDICPNGNKKAKIKTKSKYYILEHHLADIDDFKRFYSIHEYNNQNKAMSLNTTFTDTDEELYDLLYDMAIIK